MIFEFKRKSANDVSKTIDNLLVYLENCKRDKYNSEDEKSISLSEDLFGQDGKAINMWNAKKYLKRYCTSGFEKSENPKDLYKAIHYILFELERIREEI